MANRDLGEQEMKSIWREIFKYVIILSVGSSLTFGISQAVDRNYTSAKLTEIALELPHIKEGYTTSDMAIRRDVDSLRLENQERVRNITDFLKELVKQNQELISLIKAQQQIRP